MKIDIATEYFKTIGNIHRLMHRHMVAVIPGAISPLHIVIGHYLKFHKECKTTELADHLGLAASTLTGILDKMEEQKLIMRERSTTDRRVVIISPGTAFDEMKLKMQITLNEFLKEYSKDLDDQWWENMLNETKRLEELLRHSSGCRGDDCGK